MNRRMMFLAPALLAAALVAIGSAISSAADGTKADAKSAVAHVKPSAASATQPSQGKVTGTVTFTQDGNDLKVSVDLSGFPPKTEHGFHIHDKGDLSAPDLSSAGGHFNPTGEHHGGPEAEHHHAGDMGNLTSDAKGNCKTEFVIKNVSLNGDHGIIGRSVIVHAKADDLKSDPAGNSGARVAGGVIEAE